VKEFFKTFGLAWLLTGFASYSMLLLYVPYDSLLIAEGFGIAMYTTFATCLLRIPFRKGLGPQRARSIAWSLLVLGLLFFGGNLKDEPTVAWTGLLYAALAGGALYHFRPKGSVDQ
jgi:hypothetical protein